MSFFDHYDLAFISLYLFWIAFAILILYLRNEDRREGFPLVHEVRDGQLKVLFPNGGTRPKTFLTRHGPHTPGNPQRDVSGLLARTGYTPGSPFTPVGDPLQDGVGTASYALRADTPDLTFDESLPKIVPLRADPAYHLAEEDVDPRGWYVVTCDGRTVGTVADLWVDRADVLLRYLETTARLTDGGSRSVLMPLGLAELDAKRRQVKVMAVTAEQFLAAPAIKSAETITLREEDRVSSYFAGGYLYATPDRLEPSL